MIGTLGAIIIAAGASVSFFIVVAVSLILFLRADDRKRRREEEVARQFGAGQRGRLSVGSSNYSYVPEPRTNLRRSTHLPYGVVSEGWAAIPSQESLPRYQRTLVNCHPGSAGTLTHQKRRRSLRASFSAHSFSLPKTRRQKKIERAIPLRTMPCSPLSAITEQSGTNTIEACSSIGIAELPTEITPKGTPDKDSDALPPRKAISPQWPLTSSKRMSCTTAPTIKPVPTSRNSTLTRIDSTGNSISPVRPSLGQRSISISSTISTAPEDPLPPLPSITPTHWPNGRKAKFRLSAASVDTIGSSVLGGGRTSPSQTETDLTLIGLGTPSIDLNPTGLQGYDRESLAWESAIIITTGSPKARHLTQYRSGKAGYASLKASIGVHSSSQNTTTEQAAGSRKNNSIPQPTRSTLTTIDASNWSSNLSSRANSVKSSISTSRPAHVGRTASGYRKGTVAARHSMYEHHSAIGGLLQNSPVLRDVSGNQSTPVRRLANSRPASVASENPFNWDRSSLQIGLSSAMRTSPSSQRKGHKRQNCVRISNIPVVDTSRRTSKLPQMTEEEEDSMEKSGSKTVTIPGLTLLEEGKGGTNGDVRERPAKSSPSPISPVLEQASWKRPRYSRASSSESMVSCKRDSDVFSNSRSDPSKPNIFTENSTSRRQWPLSPTAGYRARLQPTPPLLKAIQEPCDPDSPTLPMPTISSATLFARALPLGTRISGVQGPRDIPISGRSSRAASPSPITARSAAKREDFRRSVMTLRRMNSDSKDKSKMSQSFHNIGDESTNSLLEEGKQSEEASTVQSPTSGSESTKASTAHKALNPTLQVPAPNAPRVSVSPSVASTLTVSGLHFSKSRSKIAPSPSIMSTGATSIWEDASVRGDSPEPELPTSSRLHSPELLDVEAYENFIGQDKRSQQDRDRESRLTSPQGKGLGLLGVQLQGKVRGTPGSLYDRDGFLKE
jgi:hypothetical protein